MSTYSDSTQTRLNQSADNSQARLNQGINSTQSGLNQGINSAQDSLNRGINSTQSSLNQGVDSAASGLNQGYNSAASTLNQAADNTRANLDYAADRTSQAADNTRANVNYAADRTSQAADNARANVNYAADVTQANAHQAAQNVKATANQASQNAKANLNQAGERINQSAQNASAKIQQTAGTAQARLSEFADQAAHHPLVQQTQAGAQRQLNALDRELAKFGFLNDLEARTKVPKTYGVLGFSIFFGLLIVLNLFGLAQPITNLIGWAIPAYLSCQALESPQKGDDAQWLCYWIVFGTLNFAESAMLRVILYYFPYYFTFKLFATIWLMLPSTRGAEKVYYTALRPLFQQGKAKAQQVSAQASRTPGAAHTNPTTGYSSAGTGALNSDSVGYSTGVSTHPSIGSHNPFVATSSESVSGMEGLVPQAAGLPLPDVPARAY